MNKKLMKKMPDMMKTKKFDYVKNNIKETYHNLQVKEYMAVL